MISASSPFQQLFSLSENFHNVLAHADKKVSNLYIRSVDDPANAFFICPSKISRILYGLLGRIRMFLRLDKIQHFDQKANLSIIHSLFKQALPDLTQQNPEAIRQVINFVTACDLLGDTKEGQAIFANYVAGKELLSPAEQQSPLEIFYHCLQTLPVSEKEPKEALKRLCLLTKALHPDLQKTSATLDDLFARLLQKEGKAESAWIEGQKNLHEAGVLLPKGSLACDALLSKEVSEEVLRSVFLENLSSQQLEKAIALADDFYAGTIASLADILRAWEKIRLLVSSNNLTRFSKVSERIVEQLTSLPKIALQDRYQIFHTVKELLPKEQQTRVAKAWIAEIDPEDPLQGIFKLLTQIAGKDSCLPLHPDMFIQIIQKYQAWLHAKCESFSRLKILEQAEKIAGLAESQSKFLSSIETVCPPSIQEPLLKQTKEILLHEIPPLLQKLNTSLKMSTSSYQEAMQSHHDLTAIQGYLHSIQPYPEQKTCLEKITNLLKNLDSYLEQKNPQVHVVKGGV